MTSVWRIDKKKHIESSSNGEGARLYGGRWNHRGTDMIYTSQALSLASLEKFVHLASYNFKFNLQYLEIIIPKEVAIQTLGTSEINILLKKLSTQDIGNMWVKESETAVLKIPSAIIPIEYNYLINPTHSDFKKIRIGRPIEFEFDDRMWKSNLKKANIRNSK